jgi:predicted nucleic acid-binding protein
VKAERYVLDTSALFSFMEDAPGSGFVEQILNDPKAAVLIPWPVLFEVYYTTRRRKGEKEADRRYVLVKELPAEIVWAFDEARLLAAARLKARFPLSFADAIIAAMAERERAVLVHKDPEFDALEGVVRLRSLPYKS